MIGSVACGGAAYGSRIFLKTSNALDLKVYLLMIVAQELVYRRYETIDSYHWATTLMREKYTELLDISIISLRRIDVCYRSSFP